MSLPTAKDLLAQADRLMRQRTPEELPVLTDLVIEEIEIPSLSERMDEVIPTRARRAWTPALPAMSSTKTPVAAASAPVVLAASVAAAVPSAQSAVQPILPAQPTSLAAQLAPSPPLAALFTARPRATSDGPTTQTALASVREQFNEQLLAKLEELQHSVFNQVMQKLEIHAIGSLKTHLRETLEPALMGIACDLAEQVAEDTATQVREVAAKAVEAEITRLREQIARRR